MNVAEVYIYVNSVIIIGLYLWSKWETGRSKYYKN